MKPLVSIITPTTGKQSLWERCGPSVLGQTYPHIEWVVVADGPLDLGLRVPSAVYGELGRNWHSFVPGGCWGTAARLAAGLLCHGDLIAYIDDDDELLPDHVSALVDLQQKYDCDWVYSQMRVLLNGESVQIVGDGRPRWRHISQQSLLHKTELLIDCPPDPLCRWNHEHLPILERPAAQYGSDWDMVGRWLEAKHDGWAFLPQVTVHHYRYD